MPINQQQASRPSPLHFARFEFKYILPAQLRIDVESDLQYFLQYDPFVAERDNHRYVVRSLYYDDPVYSAFQSKVDGQHSRSKFRLRTYGLKSNDETPLFLEIKGRHNNLVFKHRVPVDRGGVNWSALSADVLTSTIIEKADASSITEQFKYELLRKKLRPVALIDYERRPYVSKFDPSFRLTFDEKLMATKTDQIYPLNASRPKEILPGYTVLEVKFRHLMPSWFHRIIQAHELRRVSISKICSGMETLGLAFDEN
jgi:SPX domain protein involved in polyphosphate accumulation